MALFSNYCPLPGMVGNDDVMGQQHVLSNPLIRRPFFPDKGRNMGHPCVIVNTGEWTTEKGVRTPIRRQKRIRDLQNAGIHDETWFTANATSLRKEQWIHLDAQILLAARPRLKAWSDAAAAVPYGSFDAMNHMTMEYEAMSDPGEAVVDMEGATEGRNDMPLFDLRSLPLPITHSDFNFSQRKLGITRNGSMPLDTTMGELAGRRVAEMVEKTLIGTETGASYGYQSTGITAHNSTILSTVWGYLNYPHRNTKTNMTAPTTGGWYPSTTLSELNLALNTLRGDNFFGPFMIYHSTDWDPYLDGDYYVTVTSGAVAPTRTLRERILGIKDIADVRRLDLLLSSANPFTLIIVQMTSDVIRAINGMAITTVQWPTQGGLRLNFKTMAIQVPNLRSDYDGRCGIMICTTS